jgi:TonB-dependent receptor
MVQRFLLLIAVLLLFVSNIYANATGSIVGVVKDGATGEPLIGANVQLKGTAFGAATNLDGEYRISGVPVGSYSLVVTFIGYKRETLPVNVTLDDAVRQNVGMEFEAVSGDSVVVTALLEGQAQAINRQLSANTIVNVVSPDKIQALPDQNAAESLGRLPAISVQRDAGEGTKVVVRGLSPRFNSITVNGERIPATDPDNRSVDLSMISPELLAGIEVFKALTPDKDADAVGGTINLTVRKAREGFEGNARFQTGYNNHENDYGQYKGDVSAGNRFFGNRLGVRATGSLQRADRSSDILDASYLFSRDLGAQVGTVSVEDLNLGDRLETRDRYGASLTMDYDLGNGNDLLLSSLWGRTERDELRRRKRYRVDAGRTEYDLRDREVNSVLFSNSLSGHHNLLGLEIDWRGSYSRSTQEIPFAHSVRFQELAAFRGDLIKDQGPQFIPLGAKNDLGVTFFKESIFDQSEVADRDLTAQLDINLPIRVVNNLAGFLKFGGKVRDKNRDRDNTRFWTSHFGIDDLASDGNPGAWQLTSSGFVAINNFIDPNFHVRNSDLYFNGAGVPPAGQYLFGPGLSLDLINEFGQTYRNHLYTDGSPLYVRDPNFDLEDYAAGEQIYAGYAMLQLSLGSRLMILPGVRYEKTSNDYQSIFGNPYTNEDGQIVGVLTDTTGGQDYDEFLPMVHMRVKPLSWFDVRLAATRTISRPDYFNLVPWQRIENLEALIEQGNPNIKHTKVWNYDAHVSFYNRLGLFTVGLFTKTLRDIDYLSQRRATVNGRTYKLTEPVNSEGETTVKGFELELQTNLKFLPSPFNGIVLYGNYARINSETFYPFFDVVRLPPTFQLVTIDTVRAGVMPGQADYIANLSIGYEKGGFSGRVSLITQGESLQFVGTRSELDGYEDGFTRWDIAVQQEIGRGISLFLNFNNVTAQAEGAYLGSRLFPTRTEFFGWTGDIGVRYKF